MRSVRRGAQPSVGPETIGIGVDGGIHMDAAYGHAGRCLRFLSAIRFLVHVEERKRLGGC